MKYLREFLFMPTWKSRGYSFQTNEDKYSLPSFNKICEFLENKGWEIHSWEYIEDSGVNGYGYHKIDDMHSLKVYALKDAVPVQNNESYYIYKMTKDGLIGEFEDIDLDKKLKEVLE